MSYLDSLSQQKKSREDYEEDLLKSKLLIIQIESLQNRYGREFLTNLEIFLKDYKQKTNK